MSLLTIFHYYICFLTLVQLLFLPVNASLLSYTWRHLYLRGDTIGLVFLPGSFPTKLQAVKSCLEKGGYSLICQIGEQYYTSDFVVPHDWYEPSMDPTLLFTCWSNIPCEYSMFQFPALWNIHMCAFIFVQILFYKNIT